MSAFCSVSCRSMLVFWGFTGFIIVYGLRVNLSVAMVAMVYTNSSSSVTQSECIPVTNETNPRKKNGEFHWDETEQGIILGSFFWGYLFTQIPGAYLAHRFSAKWTFGIGVLFTALLTLLTPLAARFGVYVLILLRILEGLFEGVTFSSMHTLLGRWAPPLERSKMASLVYSGCQMGTIVGQPLAGYLCETDFLGGWPSVFYMFGSMGVVWFFGWMYCVYNYPQEHPRISEEEKKLIVTSIQIKCQYASHHSVPWSRIVKSPPFLALLVVHTCNNWSWYTLITCLPKYMAAVLGFQITENGFLSSLPYACDWVMTVVAGLLADYIRSRDILSTVAVRKIWTIIGLCSVGGGLVAVGYVGCDYILSIIFFCIAVGLLGFCQSGFNMNHLDIAPQYAGSLVGVTNTVATLPGIFGPYVVGVITESGQTRAHWITIFFITAAISVFGALVFTIFGSGVVQPWAMDDAMDDEDTQDEDTDRDIFSSDAESNPRFHHSASIASNPAIRGISVDNSLNNRLGEEI